MALSSNYPDFDYEPHQLTKFIAASDFVTILVADGRIIHHSPKDQQSFIKWLVDNHIKNLRDDNKTIRTL